MTIFAMSSTLVFLTIKPLVSKRLAKFLKITSCLALLFLYLSVFEVQQDPEPRYLNDEIVTFAQFKQQKQRYEKAKYYYNNLFSIFYFVKDKYDDKPNYVDKIKNNYKREKRNLKKIYNPTFIQLGVFLLFTFLGGFLSVFVEIIFNIYIYFYSKKQKKEQLKLDLLQKEKKAINEIKAQQENKKQQLIKQEKEREIKTKNEQALKVKENKLERKYDLVDDMFG